MIDLYEGKTGMYVNNLKHRINSQYWDGSSQGQINSSTVASPFPPLTLAAEFKFSVFILGYNNLSLRQPTGNSRLSIQLRSLHLVYVGQALQRG